MVGGAGRFVLLDGPRNSTHDPPLMFDTSADVSDLAHAIQLALAPVFLLTGIAGMLNVLVGREVRLATRTVRIPMSLNER
jgi:hypothetical protein